MPTPRSEMTFEERRQDNRRHLDRRIRRALEEPPGRGRDRRYARYLFGELCAARKLAWDLAASQYALRARLRRERERQISARELRIALASLVDRFGQIDPSNLERCVEVIDIALLQRNAAPLDTRGTQHAAREHAPVSVSGN